MSLDGAITNLASWAGNTMMPTMAGMFFAGAVYRYSKSAPFENLLYGGFASLLCSGMLRAYLQIQRRSMWGTCVVAHSVQWSVSGS